MDICYYFNQVKEELDGADDYIKRAIACKTEHPDWASMYVRMSEAELGHAQGLMDIFEDDFKASKTEDPIYEQLHDSLSDMYTEYAARINVMHQIFSAK